MRVFVAGETGVLGRRLMPQLVGRGYEVVATTTSPDKTGLVESWGATAMLMDGLDASSVGEAVASARPDAIVHQLTAAPPSMLGVRCWIVVRSGVRVVHTGSARIESYEYG